MRFVIAICLTLLVLPAQARDQDIQGVISDQIAAFQADDFVRAFTFASPAIKGIFENPERFGRMVRGGYPMVYRPRAMRFGDLVETERGPVQKVFLTDQTGRLWEAHYQMIETETGWQINGVSIEEVDLGV